MRTQIDYTGFFTQRTNLRKPSRHDGLCQMNDFCRFHLTTEVQKGYRGGTIGVQGVQEGYRGGTIGVQGIQGGYTGGTIGVQ